MAEKLTKEQFYSEVDRHYREHFKVLINVYASRLRGRHNAEDVVQEAYTKVLEHWETYKPELASFNVWFENVLKNCAKTHMTKEKMHGMVYDTDSVALLEASVDAGGFSASMLADIEREIAKQPVPRQLILQLALFQQETYSEIAQALAVSQQYVKNTVSKFRKELAA